MRKLETVLLGRGARLILSRRVHGILVLGKCRLRLRGFAAFPGRSDKVPEFSILFIFILRGIRVKFAMVARLGQLGTYGCHIFPGQWIL